MGMTLQEIAVKMKKEGEDRPPFANYGWIEFSYFTTVWNNGDCSSAENWLSELA